MREIERRVAAHMLGQFDQFYNQFRDVPRQAKHAFERCHFSESVRLSNLRLRLYSESIRKESERIARLYPAVKKQEARWDDVERHFRASVESVYHADLALAYLHSIRRKIYISEWLVADYASRPLNPLTQRQMEACYCRIDLGRQAINVAMIESILDLEKFQTPFQDITRDAERIVARLERNLKLKHHDMDHPVAMEMFRAGFYRNRGAYLVGRFSYMRGKYRPFIIALLHNEPRDKSRDQSGIYVDAVINSATYAHNMFSSTLANFHVTNDYYHELCLFLKSIMPMRPIGLHYSTIGYNHLGKLAVMREMEQEIKDNKAVFSISPGARGTVAIGFSTPGCSYHAKVIRNVPTDNYKWDKFYGVNSVLEKYTRVHEINRSDSMLDSIIYYKLRLPKSWFDEELRTELLAFVHHSIEQDAHTLLFRYLIVQRRLRPLPVYLETATDRQARTIMINLGYCIKNNAAANIFNKDLDARNYGVTAYSKVYLYDYDAIETLGDVKVRSNSDRFDGEEDIPDWYFEDGFVFLPEELPSGLCLSDRNLRRIFAREHHALLTTDYWDAMQRKLASGEVPRVSVYPDSERVSGHLAA